MPGPPTGSGGAGSGGAGSGGAPLGTGGVTSTGGGTGTGGAGSGGAPATGGSSTGGSATTGGASSGGGSATGGASSGGSGTGGGSSGTFTLTSSELADGAEFMPKHTCEMSGFGEDEMPPLVWTNPPEGTMSYALVFNDVTILEDGTPGNDSMGYHWAIWDIPGEITELPAGMPACGEVTPPLSCEEFVVALGNGGYLGPCPSGDLHDYEFRLYAMPTETATLPGSSLNAAFEQALADASLGMAVLHGQSDATAPPP